MGYLICRVMRTYGMAYQEVMSMPMRAFWTVSGFVDRLLADEGKLTLEIQTVASDKEVAQSLYERLMTQAPEPVKLTGYAKSQVGAERDQEGFDSLRALAG